MIGGQMSGHGPPQRQRTNTIGASICCVEDAETAARAATDATDATTDALLCIFNDRITYLLPQPMHLLLIGVVKQTRFTAESET